MCWKKGLVALEAIQLANSLYLDEIFLILCSDKHAVLSKVQDGHRFSLSLLTHSSSEQRHGRLAVRDNNHWEKKLQEWACQYSSLLLNWINVSYLCFDFESIKFESITNACYENKHFLRGFKSRLCTSIQFTYPT